jgi:hypothetical protein
MKFVFKNQSLKFQWLLYYYSNTVPHTPNNATLAKSGREWWAGGIKHREMGKLRKGPYIKMVMSGKCTKIIIHHFNALLY